MNSIACYTQVLPLMRSGVEMSRQVGPSHRGLMRRRQRLATVDAVAVVVAGLFARGRNEARRQRSEDSTVVRIDPHQRACVWGCLVPCQSSWSALMRHHASPPEVVAIVAATATAAVLGHQRLKHLHSMLLLLLAFMMTMIVSVLVTAVMLRGADHARSERVEWPHCR